LDTDWQTKIFILGLLFVLSAFFSGSEVALFSLNRNKIKNDIASHPFTGDYVLRLIQFPRRLLVTILIGNTLVNVAASIIAVSLALQYAVKFQVSEDTALTIQIVALTILIIIIGELTPKIWALKNPISFSRIVAFPLYYISVILYPIAETLTELIILSTSKMKFDRLKNAISSEDINELAELSHEKGTIVEEEHGLIKSIVEFQTVSVREVMTPRVDIIAISIDTDFDQVLRTITSSGHSRIPLYKDNLDDIVGILYAKDLLPYLKDQEKRKSLSFSKIARKAMFIPESKMINDLMLEFQEKKMHIAIVVDEYGGTSGLIALEDIIEEIIGEIRDEYDQEENSFVKLTDNSFMALGKISMDELNEHLQTNIETGNNDFDTLGGLILNYAGNIPKEGYTLDIENHRFVLKEIVNKRINKVLIEKLSEQELSK